LQRCAAALRALARGDAHHAERIPVAKGADRAELILERGGGLHVATVGADRVGLTGSVLSLLHLHRRPLLANRPHSGRIAKRGEGEH